MLRRKGFVRNGRETESLRTDDRLAGWLQQVRWAAGRRSRQEARARRGRVYAEAGRSVHRQFCVSLNVCRRPVPLYNADAAQMPSHLCRVHVRVVVNVVRLSWWIWFFDVEHHETDR